MISETLTYSDYSVYEITQSKIDPDKEIRVEIGFKCPRCKKLMPQLKHGILAKQERLVCEECKISFALFGNDLVCWMDEPV